ncbi:MAG: DUF916 domain-containing protein [Nigerium sp.]|nr:DUF916 domain-containing protein [Nigerium sp.]
MTRLIRRLLEGALVATLLATGVVAPTASAETAAWSVKPADNDHGNARANYAYTVEPGQVLEDAAVVTNHGAESLTLAVYAADGFTTADGLLDLVPTGAASEAIGAWTTVGVPSVTIAPNASATVPFTLTVPDHARPGDHVGGLVTSLRSTSETEALSIDRRLASKIAVRVPGTLTVDATVTGVRLAYTASGNPFAPGSATLSYRLANTGNALIYTREQVGIAGLFGLASGTALSGETPEILPGSSIERTVEIPDVWPLFLTRASVDVTPIGIGVSGAADAAHGSAFAWTVSLVWTAAALLVVAVAGVLVWRAIARRRTARAASVSASAGTPESGIVAASTPSVPALSPELAARIEQAREAGRAEARRLAAESAGASFLSSDSSQPTSHERPSS